MIWSCYIAIGLGTLFGGWRIVKTMGQRITKLKPVGGFCAETGGAMTLFLATGLGIPVSTTHTITGAIVGVGSVRSASAVRWGVAGNIVWAWVFTIPASALIAARVLLDRVCARSTDADSLAALLASLDLVFEVALATEGDASPSAPHRRSAAPDTAPITVAQPVRCAALAG